MKAVSSEITPVEPDEYGRPCKCNCGQAVFVSDLDRLCKLLFGALPLGVKSEHQIPNIEIWNDGVEMEGGYRMDDDNPYTFTIEEDGEDPNPKKADVIYYKGRFYVIGDVKTVDNPYLEIEPEVLWVNPDWAVDNNVYSNLTWNVK